MFLTPDPGIFFCDRSWLNDIDWKIAASNFKKWHDRDCWRVRSHRIYLDYETKIEFSLGLPSRVLVDPIERLESCLDSSNSYN